MPHRDRPTSFVTVDLVILTVRELALNVLVIERGNPPYQGAHALPGGFLEPDEDLDQAARRELAEETGLDGDTLHIEQLRSYGAPDRDPLDRVVTVCYVAFMADLPLPVAGGDARAAHWMPVNELLQDPSRLAFDHHHLLSDAVEHARDLLTHTTLATTFCPTEFTITQLRAVYEIVWGTQLDPSNFRRKVLGVPDFLVPTETKAPDTGGRPAARYRAGIATRLHPPILREPDTGVDASL
jgi:8-oxo-dGTP diphosphatase